MMSDFVVTQPAFFSVVTDERGNVVVPVGVDRAGQQVTVLVGKPRALISVDEIIAALDRTAGSISDLERPHFYNVVPEHIKQEL